MKRLSAGWLIHIFALLHAVVTLCCRMAGIGDELFLTVLTMAMALLICMKKTLSIEFTAAIIIVVNIIGFLMGTLVANLLELFIGSVYAVHALSTAITTEILGWSIIALTTIFRQNANADKNRMSWDNMKWVLLAAGGVFALRLIVVFVFSRGPFVSGNALMMAEKVMSNSVAITTLICLNILYVRFAIKLLKGLSSGWKFIILTTFMLIAALLEAVIVNIGLPFTVGSESIEDFPTLFFVSLLAQITIYCIVYMVNYALTTRSEMQVEREKANMAQYRYVKLKRQVNPHFLFNSLNILDCLICEEKTEQASVYTHKLAGLYRYMIKSEDEDVVPLREELAFVNQYVDLLKVRFPEGFEVEIDVDEALLVRSVPPCSLQLLIENATKHNAVSTDNPLIVKISSDGESICVSNNVIPKVTRATSTGLGQNYIRQLYLDLSGKAIAIDKTDVNYCVTLPLL